MTGRETDRNRDRNRGRLKEELRVIEVSDSETSGKKQYIATEGKR